MLQEADKKCKEIEFQPGDLVYLKLQPYKQRSLTKRLNHKLSSRYYGPYKIIQRVGTVAYKLVFHVPQLKLATGVTVPTSTAPPVTADLELAAQPVDILEIRQLPTGTMEVLVLWEGMDSTEATWEDSAKLLATYPSTHLEDKVNALAGGIVTNAPVQIQPVLKTYQRRIKIRTGGI